jgi:3-oxoacyl-[acyl-carrier protein] reductase
MVSHQMLADCRVVIVTGGSRGIGRAVVELLAGLDYAVVVNYVHDQPIADATVDAVLSRGGAAIAVRADITDEMDVERLFAATTEAFGGIDAVVHCVRGFSAAESIAAMPVGEFTEMFRTSAFAAFMIHRVAARQLPDGGAIVNVFASVDEQRLPAYGAHAATAGAIAAITRLFALELQHRRIAVNGLTLDVDGGCEPDRVAEIVARLLSGTANAEVGQVCHIDRLNRNETGRRE